MNLAKKQLSSFNKRDIHQLYGGPEDSASRLLKKCVDLGWMVREKIGVYHFV